MKKDENYKGFTIIEVALVLAIAGLIFMMVFIALPALQRNSADARRRDDIAILLGAIKKYQSNNRGALPSDWINDLNGYLPSSFSDPDGSTYALTETKCNKTGGSSICNGTSNVLKNIESQEFPNGHIMYIVRGASCDGNTVKESANKRKVAVIYKLEGGGVFCNNT